MVPRTPPPPRRMPNSFADSISQAYSGNLEFAAEPSPPVHKGPHRDGFTTDKCKTVLIKHCSWIPRNYTYRDGVSKVYAILREYLGDENMDLATAQLNELIEVPSDWASDEGAAFQSWRHDYMLRDRDLENAHVPSLGNVIVAPVLPTKRLMKWREDNPGHDRGNLSNVEYLQRLPSLTEKGDTPVFGIGAGVRRSEWKLENAFFISSRAEGTQVLNVPTAQELHARTWDLNFGRGGKLVQERNISAEDMTPLPSCLASDSQQTETRNSLLSLSPIPSVAKLGPTRRIRAMNLEVSGAVKRTWLRKVRSRFMDRQREQVEASGGEQDRLEEYPPDPLAGRFAEAVRAYENSVTSETLPDPDNDEGKAYYRNVPTQPLPPGSVVPHARFARKHGLTDKVTLLDETKMGSMPTADELAIEKNFKDSKEHFGKEVKPRPNGPFTPELFKDGGIDFLWGVTGRAATVSERDTDVLSDVASLGDASQSPMRCLPSVSRCFEKFPGWFHSPSLSFGGVEICHDSNGSFCHTLYHHQVHSDLSSQSHTAQVRGTFRRNDFWSGFFWWDEAGRLSTKVARTGVSTSPGTGAPLGPQTLLFYKSKQDCPQTHHRSHLLNFSVLTQPKSPLSRIVAFIEMRRFHKEPTMGSPDGNRTPILAGIIPRGLQHAPTNSMSEELSLMNHPDKGWASVKLAENSPSESGFFVPKDGLEPIITDEMPLDMRANPFGTGDIVPDDSSTEISLGPAERHKLNMSYERLKTGLYDSKTLRAWDTENLNPKQFESDRDRLFSRKPLGSVQQLLETPDRLASFPLDHGYMDLDCGMHPPPSPVLIKSLNVRKRVQYVLKGEEPATQGEILHPDRYDPARDGFRHGGVQYHRDSIRIYPKPAPHPARSSSLRNPRPSNLSRANPVEQLEKAKRENPSSDIMGNFIALSPTHFVPRTEAKKHVIPATMYQTHMGATVCHKSFGSADANDDPPPRGGQKKGFEVQDYATNIDVNDPRALGKYIDYTKKDDPEQLAKQSVRTSDFSEYTDEDVQSLSNGIDNRSLREVKFEGRKDKAHFDITDFSEMAMRNPYEFERDSQDDGTFSEAKAENEGINRLDLNEYIKMGKGNPYEFEPDNQNYGLNRLTTLGDFINGVNVLEPTKLQSPKKQAHLKNSASESNALNSAKRTAPIDTVKANMSTQPLYRSGSSPGIPPSAFAARLDDNPGLLSDPARGRGRTRASINKLEAVAERHEGDTHMTPTTPKRSNSPIKRFFGEGGWRGGSSNSKEPSSQKKPSFVSRFKLKMEEIALKADLAPVKSAPKPRHEKSLVAISINTAQQAQLYLDIELIICDTANTFLMHEYQSCRMSVDSLKKVTDFWKSKGRPQVMEFQYDQLTQRDIIVANQKTFRFRSPSSGDELKINAMLYTWKSNAREMAVRTFCYPDAMIKKHIRDTFTILDFLGGHPVQYLALHEVNAKMIAWTKAGQQHNKQKHTVGLGLDGSKRVSDEPAAESSARNHRAGPSI